jgi:hypothetical protein
MYSSSGPLEVWEQEWLIAAGQLVTSLRYAESGRYVAPLQARAAKVPPKVVGNREIPG